MSVEDVLRKTREKVNSQQNDELRMFEAKSHGYVEPGSDQYNKIIRFASKEAESTELSQYELERAIESGYKAVMPVGTWSNVGLQMVTEHIQSKIRPKYYRFSEKTGKRGYNLIAYAIENGFITSVEVPDRVTYGSIRAANRDSLSATSHRILTGLGGK